MATASASASRSVPARAPVPQVMKQGRVVPWFYLLPAIIVMTFFIVYPMFNTIYLSFMNDKGTATAASACVTGQPCWGIFENYRYALTAELNLSSPITAWDSFWVSSYGNNIKWIILMVTGTVVFGLLMAVLSDRVRYEPLAKSIIFVPMAISFVGAGVIWKFVYAYTSGGVQQIGLLNAILVGLGAKPVAWLTVPQVNTLALIVVGVWIWTGFAMTILAAALKGVPDEILEASRVDGANEFQVFFQIMLPLIAPTVTVVITTMVINTLKLFDLVYVMTGGNYGTDVIALRMYREMYNNFNTGRGTAVAVILVIVILPFVYMNIKRFLAQEAIR